MYTQTKSSSGSLAKNQDLILRNMTLPAYVAAGIFLSDRPTLDRNDLIQSGYLGLVKAARAYDPKRGVLFRTFASRCIRNEILGIRQKDIRREREVSLPMCDLEDLILEIAEQQGPEEEYLQKETIHALRRELKSLPEKERQILELRYGGSRSELTQSEAARKLGVSQPYICKVEKKALKHLREKLRRDL